MKTLLFLILLIPSISFSQTSNVFIKLTDSKGMQITGDASTKGFERTIRAFTTSSAGRNNTQFIFTMPVTGAGAVLKSAMAGGERLLNATVTVMTTNTLTGTLQPSYTIVMERIQVISCAESMGCNNVMTTGVTLQATRIGWTYYTSDRSGTNVVVSQKYGYDAETGSAWTKF
ncbi:MAG: type VI secretion system tube protein Hcp [Bacteroidales bacterium]|jgi:type VI protein secretion system component Hcp|nr:type VI secretion system tube protein Hcp [Bacteroidales bacterium]